MNALIPVATILLAASAAAAPLKKEKAAFDAARAGLASADAGVRARAAWDMGQLGFVDVPEGETESAVSVSMREAAAAEILPAVSDPAPLVRARAVEALGKLEGGGEETLLSASTDIDPGVRGEFALALFRRRFLKRVPEYSSASFRRLADLSADREAEVRWRAVYAFTRFPDARAETVLRAAQKDSDATVRLFAVRSLGKLGAPADKSLLADPDLYVRAEAAASYGAAKKAAALPDSVYADASAHVRAAAADAVAATGDAALASKLETMADSDGPLARGARCSRWPSFEAPPRLRASRRRAPTRGGGSARAPSRRARPFPTPARSWPRARPTPTRASRPRRWKPWPRRRGRPRAPRSSASCATRRRRSS
ncbi:MAG: HEAT repeat domain-containing protein [Elusimicrobiota bacterium]|nr:MAG: HEAT repeat domain-containing protein [Elusimicrobiota bacterium]